MFSILKSHKDLPPPLPAQGRPMIARNNLGEQYAFSPTVRRLTLAFAWILLSVPIFLITVLPSVDFPNHLARVYLLAHWGQLSGAGYNAFYQPHWAILPNLALDLIIIPLAKVLPTFLAGQIFVALSIGITIYGGARLNKAIGGYWSLWCLAPALLVYNRIFTYGFFNFVFGIGLMALALAVHIERRNAKPWSRLWPAILFCLGLFACHLMALAMFAVAAGGYALGRDLVGKKSWRKFALDIGLLFAQLLLPLLLLLMGSPTAGEATTMDFRDMSGKLHLLDTVFQTGQNNWDKVFAIVVLLVFIVLWGTKQIKFEKRMVWPLGLVSFVFLIAPYGFKDAFNVDTRLPLVVAIVAFVSFVPTSKRAAMLGGLIVCALLGFRAVTTGMHYAAWQKNISQAQADLRLVPAGSMLFQTRNVDSRAFDADGWDPPAIGLDCLLLFDRPVFISNFFTIPTQQPLVRTNAYDNLEPPLRVGAEAAPTLASYAGQIDHVTDLRNLHAPQYVWYLKAPGPLEVPPSMKALVIRKRYALLELLPDATEVAQGPFVTSREMKKPMLHAGPRRA